VADLHLAAQGVVVDEGGQQAQHALAAGALLRSTRSTSWRPSQSWRAAVRRAMYDELISDARRCGRLRDICCLEGGATTEETEERKGQSSERGRAMSDELIFKAHPHSSEATNATERLRGLLR